MIEVKLDGPDFARLNAALKGADKKIQREMRKAIRKAGDDAVRDIRAEIMAVPSSGGGTGVREALATGTTVAISARGKNAGVTIKTSPSRLPASKRALAKAFNKPSFRHRVFGSGNWVNQPGNPYFGKVVAEHYTAMRSGILEAMATAERAISADVNRSN